MMRRSSAILIATFCALGLRVPAYAQGFKFSNPSEDERKEAAEQQDKQARVDWQLSAPCRQKIKNRKIMVLVGEERNGYVSAPQSNFTRHVEAINSRLQSLGLKTYSAEQIRKQVAQEEVDAYFKNDPDRALSAAKRLSAQYVLKGVIATQAFHNQMVNVNQVNVALDFTLADAAGRPVSTAHASNASYAGTDVSGMALKLIEERADEVVAQLYSDYCSKAR
jgi:hypothetical protein